MHYLLDTNIVSDLIREPEGRVARRIGEVGEALIRTKIIVAADLRFGATKRGAARLTAQPGAAFGARDRNPPGNRGVRVARSASPRMTVHASGDATDPRRLVLLSRNDLQIGDQHLAFGLRTEEQRDNEADQAAHSSDEHR